MNKKGTTAAIIGTIIFFILMAMFVFLYISDMGEDYKLYEKECLKLNTTHFNNGGNNLCIKILEDNTIKYYYLQELNDSYYLLEK